MTFSEAPALHWCTVACHVLMRKGLTHFVCLTGKTIPGHGAGFGDDEAPSLGLRMTAVLVQGAGGEWGPGTGSCAREFSH